MVEKKCFKCGRLKSIDEFYKHPAMADGYLGKCKECAKKDVRKNRVKNIDYYREYDRERGNRQTKELHDAYKKKYPTAHKARAMVAKAIREGKLFREPCQICKEENVHAHHDDYAKPLNIRWLCAAHHSQWHKKNGEGKNR